MRHSWLVLAFLLAGVSPRVMALSLGRVEVQSAAGQPLIALAPLHTDRTGDISAAVEVVGTNPDGVLLTARYSATERGVVIRSDAPVLLARAQN